MCPGTMAMIAIGTAAAGSITSGFAQANAAHYRAQVAENNAKIASQNAAYSAGATAAQTERAGLKAAQQSGEVRAGIAANNLDVNSGSAADVQTSQRLLGKLDQATVASRGAQQVYGYRTQATSEEAQSQYEQAQVGPDIAAGVIGAVGDIAKGAPDMPMGGGGSVQTSLISSAAQVPSDFQWMTPYSGQGVSNAVPEGF